MTARSLPGLGLTGFWEEGSSAWKDAMDSNLRKLSVHGNGIVLSQTTSLPGTPTLGDIYIVPVGDTNAGQIAVWDGEAGSEAWVYYVPKQGWSFYVLDSAINVQWSGSAWAEFAGAGSSGGAGGNSVVYSGAKIELSADNLTVNVSAGFTALALDSEVWDEGGYFDAGTPGRLTVIADVTKVSIGAFANLEAITASDHSRFGIRHYNSSDTDLGLVIMDRQEAASTDREMSGTTDVAVSLGDYFVMELFVENDTSITIEAGTHMIIRAIDGDALVIYENPLSGFNAGSVQGAQLVTNLLSHTYTGVAGDLAVAFDGAEDYDEIRVYLTGMDAQTDMFIQADTVDDTFAALVEWDRSFINPASGAAVDDDTTGVFIYGDTTVGTGSFAFVKGHNNTEEFTTVGPVVSGRGAGTTGQAEMGISGDVGAKQVLGNFRVSTATAPTAGQLTVVGIKTVAGLETSRPPQTTVMDLASVQDYVIPVGATRIVAHGRDCSTSVAATVTVGTKLSSVAQEFEFWRTEALDGSTVEITTVGKAAEDYFGVLFNDGAGEFGFTLDLLDPHSLTQPTRASASLQGTTRHQKIDSAIQSVAADSDTLFFAVDTGTMSGEVVFTAYFDGAASPTGVVQKSGAANVLETTDLNNIVVCSHATATTYTLDDVVGAAGDVITLKQGGVGDVTIVAGAATIELRAELTLVMAGQYAYASLLCEGNGVWGVTGDLVAA